MLLKMSPLRLPWSGKPKKPPKKQGYNLDPEKQSRKIAHKQLMKELSEAEGDDRREIIGQILGLKLKPKGAKSVEDQIYDEALLTDEEYREQVKQARLDAIRGNNNADPSDELNDILVHHAIEEIQNNPDLRNRAIGKKIQQIIGGRNSGSSFSEFLQELDQVDELRERLGVGEKSSGFVSQIVEGFSKNIPQILAYMSGRPVPEQQGTTYTIENPDGSTVNVDADTYIRLMEQQKRLAPPKMPPQTLNIPLQVHPEQETPSSGIIETQAESKPLGQNQSLGILSWVPYLDEEPSTFAYTLQELAKGGDEQAQLAVGFMESSSTEQVLSLLEQFRDTSEGEVKDALDRILTEKREWLGEVVTLIKTIKGERYDGSGV